MKITRRQLRNIIIERLDPFVIKANVYEMGSRPKGVDLDTLNKMYGTPAFDAIDELVEEGEGILDEEEGIFYARRSSGIKDMLKRRGLA